MTTFARNDTTWRDYPTSKLDDAEPATCHDCGDVIHDGNTCIECWRDRRTLAIERDRDWWSA